MASVVYVKVSGTWELVGVDAKKLHAKIGGVWKDMSSGSNEVHCKDSSVWIKSYPYGLDTWTAYETCASSSGKAANTPVYSADPTYTRTNINTASDPVGWDDRSGPQIGQQIGARTFGWSNDIPGIAHGTVDRLRQTYEAKYIDAPDPGSSLKIHSGFQPSSGKLSAALTASYVTITHDFTLSAWNMSDSEVNDLFNDAHEARIAGYYDNASDSADSLAVAKSFQVGMHYVHN